MTLIDLLVALIVIAVLFWAVRAICSAFAVPPQIATVIQVIMVVVVVLWLLRAFGLWSGGPAFRVG